MTEPVRTVRNIRTRWNGTVREELVPLQRAVPGASAAPEYRTVYTGEPIPKPERAALDVSYLLSTVWQLERELVHTRTQLEQVRSAAVRGVLEVFDRLEDDPGEDRWGE